MSLGFKEAFEGSVGLCMVFIRRSLHRNAPLRVKPSIQGYTVPAHPPADLHPASRKPAHRGKRQRQIFGGRALIQQARAHGYVASGEGVRGVSYERVSTPS